MQTERPVGHSASKDSTGEVEKIHTNSYMDFQPLAQGWGRWLVNMKRKLRAIRRAICCDGSAQCLSKRISDATTYRFYDLSILRSSHQFMQHFYWRWGFALCIITANFCAILRVLLGSSYASECINGKIDPGGNIVLQVAMTFLVFSVIAFFLSAFCLLSKSRSKRGWALVMSLCSKWQPSYFLILSAQRIVLRAVSLPLIFSMRPNNLTSCPVTVEYESRINAAYFIWNSAMILVGVLTFLCDLDADFTPAARRCAYGFLVLCLFLDASGSYIFGNTASQVSVSIGSVELLVDQQITSCISSQVVIALHFFFVSVRSRNGRAWAYAPLRFVLDEISASLPIAHVSGAAQGLALKTDAALMQQRSVSYGLSSRAGSETLRADPRQHVAANSRSFARTYQKWLQFRKRHVQRCRVFVIPCVKGRINAPGLHFELERPLLNLKCPQFLQNLANAFPNFLGFAFFVFSSLGFLFASIWNGSSEQDQKGMATLACSCATFLAIIIFCSSNRYNLDRVAVKHVALSFRFVACAVLLTFFVALEWRKAHIGHDSPYATVSIAVLSLTFCATALFDCSPNFPMPSQIFISVIPILTL